MNDNCLLGFHQGWTDIIICIGLIFYNLEKYKKVTLLIREDSKPMFDYIFRNITNIEILYFIKSNEGGFVSKMRNKYSNYDQLFYGFCSAQKGIKAGSYDFFYKQFGVNSEESINKFIIDRDLNIELLKYNEITNKIGKEYIIVNEDSNRNLKINRDKINSTLPLFNLNNCSDINFDMIMTIENAKELHIISTFWSAIIYLLQKKYNLFSNIPIYLHNYVRSGYYSFLYPYSNWIVLN